MRKGKEGFMDRHRIEMVEILAIFVNLSVVTLITRLALS